MKIKAIVFHTSPGLTHLNREAKTKRNPVVKCRQREHGHVLSLKSPYGELSIKYCIVLYGQLIVSYNTKSLAFNWSIGVSWAKFAS